MKTKDIMALLFAFGFLFVIGLVYMSQTKPKVSAASMAASQVEVASPIADQMDPNGVFGKMDQTYKVRDYKQQVDLSTGIGNPAPFSQ